MILVTGATGLLGSYIARYLVKSGHQVRAIKRPTSDLSLLAEAKDAIDWVEGDVLDIVSLEDAFAGVTQVYHSAATISFKPSERDYMFKVNVEGTANVVNVALHTGVHKLLFVSSVAALGKGKPGILLDEEAEWEDSPYDSGYGFSKYLAEMEVWRAMLEGLHAVILSPSMILGAGKWSDSSLKIFSRTAAGLSFYPVGTNGFVDVRDAARAAIALMDSHHHNQRFIVNSENLKYKQVIDQIARELGLSQPTIPVKGLIKTASWVTEAIKSRITGAEPVITKEVATLTANDYYYNNQRLKDAFQLEFMPIQQSITETVQLLKASRNTNSPSAVFPV